MDETGQPGAAAPGENGNGAGPHGDLARPANGWAAADSGWPRAAKPADGGPESRPQWRQPVEPPAPPSWAGDPASRYADPAAGGGASRDSGQPVNGNAYDDRHYPDQHYPDQSGVPYRAPASAPPYPYQDELDDFGPERIAVPAPRPPSPAERSGADRPAGGQERGAEPPEHAEPSRHAFGDSPTSGAGPTPTGLSPVSGAPHDYDLVRPQRAVPAPGEPSQADRNGPAGTLPADRDQSVGHRGTSEHDERPGQAAPPSEANQNRPAWARSSSGTNGWVRTVGAGEAASAGPDWGRAGAMEGGAGARPSWGRADSDPGAEPPRPAWVRPEAAGQGGEPARPAWARSGSEVQAAVASWARNEAESETGAGNSGPGAPDWSRSAPESPAAQSRAEWPRAGNEPEPGAEQARPGWASSWAPPWAKASPEPEARRARRDDSPGWPGEPAPASEPGPGYGPPPGQGGYPSPGEPGEPMPVSGPPSYPADRPWDAPYPGYPAASAGPEPVGPGHQPEPEALPQRVPAEPDVPTMPEPIAGEPSAETPELARIATHLRRDDAPAQPRERPDGFDVKAILAAVRGVPGVRDASLRTTPAGAHSLRLDLADGADPAEVSRQVARLLQDRMGLAAAPKLPGTPVPGAMLPGTPLPGAVPPGAPVSGVPVSAVPTSGPPEPGQPDGRRMATEAGPDGRRMATEGGPDEAARRRRPTHQGRAAVDERAGSSVGTSTMSGMATGSPVTAGASYSGGQPTTTETAPSRPLNPGGPPGPRVVLDHVQVSTFGLEATVEVRLAASAQRAEGLATGPAVDGYVLRLCAVAAAAAIDELLSSSARVTEMGRCFVEHAAVVPFGSCEVATVVVLLVCDGWVEQLAGSALVAGDPRQAVVRATLAAVNRRLEALLV